jgi:hypothetical protein
MDGIDFVVYYIACISTQYPEVRGTTVTRAQPRYWDFRSLYFAGSAMVWVTLQDIGFGVSVLQKLGKSLD